MGRRRVWSPRRLAILGVVGAVLWIGALVVPSPSTAQLSCELAGHCERAYFEDSLLLLGFIGSMIAVIAWPTALFRIWRPPQADDIDHVQDAHRQRSRLNGPSRRRQATLLFAMMAGVACLYLGASRVVPAIRHSVHSHEVAQARSDMTRLTVPTSYQQFTDGCTWYRCYRIDEPGAEVATTVNSVMKSVGVDDGFGATVPDPTFGQGVVPNGTAMFNGCYTAISESLARTTNCTLTGSLHGQPVILFLHPYFGGQRSVQALQQTTEVDLSFGPRS